MIGKPSRTIGSRNGRGEGVRRCVCQRTSLLVTSRGMLAAVTGNLDWNDLGLCSQFALFRLCQTRHCVLAGGAGGSEFQRTHVSLAVVVDNDQRAFTGRRSAGLEKNRQCDHLRAILRVPNGQATRRIRRLQRRSKMVLTGRESPALPFNVKWQDKRAVNDLLGLRWMARAKPGHESQQQTCHTNRTDGSLHEAPPMLESQPGRRVPA